MKLVVSGLLQTGGKKFKGKKEETMGKKKRQWEKRRDDGKKEETMGKKKRRSGKKKRRSGKKKRQILHMMMMLFIGDRGLNIKILFYLKKKLFGFVRRLGK